MVRFITSKTKIICGVMAVTILSFALAIASPAFADNVTTNCLASDPGYNGTCTSDSNFQVNVAEFLSVTVSVPDNWASGDLVNTVGNNKASDVLVNTIGLNVVTNNGSGFTAFINSANKSNGTSLLNTADNSSLIKTIGNDSTNCASSSYAYNSFPTNCWGYNITASNGTYTGVPAYSSPAVVAKGNTGQTQNKNLYFAAKADNTIPSGTYANTVIISAISGVQTDNPSVPVDPATPSDDTPNDNIATYDNTVVSGTPRNRTIYTTTTTNSTTNTTTTNTTITAGNTVSTYANAAGVTTTSIGEGTPLATGLAVTAAVAATAGVVFFIVAKRRNEDEDEDEDY